MRRGDLSLEQKSSMDLAPTTDFPKGLCQLIFSPVVRCCWWGFHGPSLTLGLVLDEVVDLADGAVEGNNGESVIGSVEDQVLSHNSQADEAEIAAGNTRILADIDAGKTCAKVSQKNASQLLESSPECFEE